MKESKLVRLKADDDGVAWGDEGVDWHYVEAAIQAVFQNTNIRFIFLITKLYVL